MYKYAIIAFLSCCCIFVSAQANIVFSKTFDSKRKNVPIAIINNHSFYFHVMRYNKAAHDFTIERRSKLSAAILAYTPLRLDSVNVDWFDYEKLDYLFFEFNHKVYFVFEKVMNRKHTIYLKVIDTLGKASGFTELSSMDGEPGVGLKFSFSKVANNNVLIVGEMSYTNGITKKTAVLFELKSMKPVWFKKLPHENSYTEISDGFTTNSFNDLFFIHYNVKSRTVINRDDMNTTIINEYGPISVIKSLNDSKEISEHVLGLNKIEAVYAAKLVSTEDGVIFIAQVVENDFGKKPYLHVEKINSTHNVMYIRKNNFPLKIAEQLTFYDGTNYKDAAYKNYSYKKSFLGKSNLYFITERKDENYYKELLNWNVDPTNGELLSLNIIPRKVFYFSGRTRFKNLGECMVTYKNSYPVFYVLEDSKNSSNTSEGFNFHSFNKQNGLFGGNVVSYVSTINNKLDKKLIYNNTNFDLVPVLYFSENATDDVFYFNEGQYEKFGFLLGIHNK